MNSRATKGLDSLRKVSYSERNRGGFMIDSSSFAAFSPTTLADAMNRDRIMDLGIRPLWPDMPRLIGPAFPVYCAPGDNLMLHAAIYRAEPGSVIVVQAGDSDYAVAGGNVCAVAQQHGIAGFVIDGAIRDLAETRENRFPIFARGIIPKPGTKEIVGKFGIPVQCGGVLVGLGDIVVADEEGVVVVAASDVAEVLTRARDLARSEAEISLSDWEKAHHAKIEQLLLSKGFAD